jgi:hypothetical protein
LRGFFPEPKAQHSMFKVCRKLIGKKLSATPFYYLLPVLSLQLSALNYLQAQDNSPYSRYGIGDIVPSTNIMSRGMGGISAAYSDFISVNFNNPASLASFQAIPDAGKKKLSSGRAVLDIGLNFDNRTLRENNNPEKFVANNILFSYMQIGIPLKKNWGLSFGLRPVSRISYRIHRFERLIDPQTQLPIDSVLTRYTGDGGVYLPTLGTGYKINNFSIGANLGYLFGKKNYSTKRSFINDTVDYYQSNHETKTTFGNIFITAGMQYKFNLNKEVTLTLGAYGNFKRELEASQDIVRETYYQDQVSGDLRLDSVSEQKNIAGSVVYPSSFTLGFIIESKQPDLKKTGWLIGMDFVQTSWKDYRFYGMMDSVRNNWELRIGGQLRPAFQKNYFSRLTYRAGFFIGPDYIKLNENLPQYGFTFGMGIPLINYNRLSPNQATFINLAFEYAKRGNNQNLLRENLFRISAGFSLSDFWFIKRKYD